MLARLSEQLATTRRALLRGLGELTASGSPDAATTDELEALLIQADVGSDATNRILEHLRHTPPSQWIKTIRATLLDLVRPCQQPLVVQTSRVPFVIMVVGVNGAGKTTTIGKLARRLKSEGHSVMLAAADTFRAAAIEQLKIWGKRNDVAVIAQESGSDAAAVAHDAVQSAMARKYDVLIIDTAGRLHTQTALMDELRKIKRVIQRVSPDAPHEVLLVLDAGIGQNALAQLDKFNAAAGVTGIAMTKLDGTAKGGVLFAIAARQTVPIRYIGIGEQEEDLRRFDAEEFVDALIPEET